MYIIKVPRDKFCTLKDNECVCIAIAASTQREFYLKNKPLEKCVGMF